MKKPPVHDDENERLATLKALEILDTPAEERFDRLTRLAQALFDVPIALVTLVAGERQWFKSCIGLSTSETSRDVSFCGHAIFDGDPLIVPDTADDERFANNPLVVNDPNIRFYAGCPIKAPNGHRLGTICIIDQKPKALTNEQVQRLKDLASIAESEIAALELAVTDEMTGLVNRRGFLMTAEKSLSLCRREGRPISLVFVDVDGLKQINDRYGHKVGDYAICAVAESMSVVCRDSDTGGRLGGDEFVLLLTEADEMHAQDVVHRLNTHLTSRCNAVTGLQHLSISCGIVAYSLQRHNSVEDILDDADSAMYRNKKTTRG